MSSDNGCNPLRWDCETQGCFNRRKRPKIEVFADCLPGRIAFTDVDALVERKGNLLFMEWKDHPEINTGQRILFERLTRYCPATVWIVEGDAEFMTVSRIRIAWQGIIGPPQAADLDTLRHWIRQWYQWADDHPAGREVKEVACL